MTVSPHGKATRQLATSSWALNGSHTPNAAAAATAFRMLITETGWCGVGAQREAQKAQWIVEAHTKLWNPDPVVAAVIPFLLAGPHWDVEGFTWARFAGAAWDQLAELMPQYIAVQSLANPLSPAYPRSKNDDGASLPYPEQIARGAARALLYKTKGLVDANQSLRHAANGAILMGTAVGEGYITPARPSSDDPICQRKCAQAGGCTDPSSPHTLCGCAPDGASVVLNCTGGGTITAVTFASVGTPGGTCGNFSAGTCAGDANKSRVYVSSQCVGKSSCTLAADINTFNSGKDPCYNVAKHAEISVACSMPQPTPLPNPPPEQAPSGMNPYPSNALPKWKEGLHTAEKYREVAAREYSMTSPENACKMDATEPEQGRFSWTGCVKQNTANPHAHEPASLYSHFLATDRELRVILGLAREFHQSGNGRFLLRHDSCLGDRTAALDGERSLEPKPAYSPHGVPHSWNHVPLRPGPSQDGVDGAGQ